MILISVKMKTTSSTISSSLFTSLIKLILLIGLRKLRGNSSWNLIQGLRGLRRGMMRIMMMILRLLARIANRELFQSRLSIVQSQLEKCLKLTIQRMKMKRKRKRKRKKTRKPKMLKRRKRKRRTIKRRKNQPSNQIILKKKRLMLIMTRKFKNLKTNSIEID